MRVNVKVVVFVNTGSAHVSLSFLSPGLVAVKVLGAER